MTIKIHQFNKMSLYEMSSVEVQMANTTSMAISQYADSIKSTEATLPFTVEGGSQHVPYISDIDYSVCIRKKVDMTAIGVNEKRIKDDGKDVGKYDYTNDVPSRPLDLPPGFQQLYKQ